MRNYQLKAFELGIIEANEKSIRPWIYNRYINQLYMVKDLRFTYTNYDRWHTAEGVTECQKLCVKPEMIENGSGINIINLIQEMINSGHYVFGRYNECFISEKKAYQKYYYVHDFIIYGYDESKQIYYSAGYLLDGKYKPFVISFDDFLASLKTVTTEKLNFHFIKYNNGIDNKINVRMIYEDLFDYLHSINRRNIVNKDKIFGIECEYVFINYLNQLIECDNPKKIDLRHAKFFSEMKSLMNERLKYLEDHSYIEMGLSEQYIQIKKIAELICMLSMKYNMTGKKDILLHLVELQTDIINKERDILNLVLNQLKYWVDNNEKAVAVK
jgi:hypothetical protein